MFSSYQHTLQHSVHCYGKGLHSGLPAALSLHPAEEDAGLTFIRNDPVNGDRRVQAHFRNVTDTMLGTTITNHDRVSVSTVEHLMAALWSCGIDNALIEIDGPEVPIMDGTSEPYLFLIECAGTVEQKRLRRVVEVLKPVEVRDGEASIRIEPASQLSVDLTIIYQNSVIATQTAQFNSREASFKMDLCRARTFCLLEEVEMLRERGLAKGGSLENAIVVGKDEVLNEGGLRYPDEFVRHKILDCLGDMYLAGHLLGHITGHCSGHRLNNMLLHQLFKDTTAWRYLQEGMMGETVCAAAS